MSQNGFLKVLNGFNSLCSVIDENVRNVAKNLINNENLTSINKVTMSDNRYLKVAFSFSPKAVTIYKSWPGFQLHFKKL